MTENEIDDILVATAITLHRDFGPGLLESVYEVLFAHRLEKAGLHIKRQVSIPIQFDGICFEEGFRADLVEEDDENRHYQNNQRNIVIIKSPRPRASVRRKIT